MKMTSFEELTTLKNESYKGVPIASLKAAFDRVTNPNDWRAPINAVVRNEDIWLIAIAIEFYTATEIKVNPINDTHTQIMSVGYRNGPAGP